jgi:hypothetical protein
MPLSRSACSSGRPAERALTLLDLGLHDPAIWSSWHHDGRVAQRRLHQQQLVDALLQHSCTNALALGAALRQLLPQPPAAPAGVLHVEVEDRAVADERRRCGRCGPVRRPAAAPRAVRRCRGEQRGERMFEIASWFLQNESGRRCAPARGYIPSQEACSCGVVAGPVAARSLPGGAGILRRHPAGHALGMPSGAAAGRRSSTRATTVGDGALEQFGAVLLAQREADGAERHDVALAVDDAAAGTP